MARALELFFMGMVGGNSVLLVNCYIAMDKAPVWYAAFLVIGFVGTIIAGIRADEA